MRTFQLFVGALAATVIFSGCGGSDSDSTGTLGATGGTISMGGSLGLGGANTASGAGAPSVGGNLGLGGVSTVTATTTPASGGNPATGGVSSGGTSSTGGSVASGGTSSVGGTTAKGGTSSVGGTTAKGGTSSVGGTTAKGGTSSVGGSSAATAPVTVYIAGDSTVSNYTDTASTTDQAGWGQMLPALFNSKVTFVNRAAGGRTAYWFHLEGGVSKILSTIKAGDYVLVQFGTNDQNTTATFTVDGVTYPRYAAAATTFKTQLKTYYLDPIKAASAIPVLVTPPPRNSAYCGGGNGLGTYATAMTELGAAEGVAVVGLSAKTHTYLSAICPKPTTAATEKFFFGKADGTIDGTHFQENGARKMAGFIAAGLKESGVGLAAYAL